MSENKVFIPILLGTTRRDRQSEHVAKWVFTKMEEREEIETHLFDVREFQLPYDNYGTGIGADFPEWRDAIIRADGLVIVTPEYNHGYPGPLKTAIDSASSEWHAKPVGFVSYGGLSGGLLAVEQLRLVFAELHAVTVRETVSFHGARVRFDEHGRPRDADAVNAAAGALLDQLAWWARALREARALSPYGT